MALTDEQRAMLQLLLEGGQGYEDIGSLLGIPPDQVRTRARDALRDMGGADPDAQVGLSDYLLGQADPIGRADAVRHLQNDPDANALAGRLVQQLRLIAPKGQLPDIPEPKGGRRATAPPPPTSTPAAPAAPSAPATETPSAPTPAKPSRPGIASRAASVLSGKGGLGANRGRLIPIAVIAGIAVIVAIIFLATGGGDNGEECQTVDTSAAQQAGVPSAELTAVGETSGDCKPTGQVTLSPVQQATTTTAQQQAQFALQINAANLEPTGDGDTYLLWLYKSDTESFPLGQQTVDESGNLTGGVPLSTAQVLVLTAFDQIRLSRVTTEQVTQVQQSVQAQAGQKNATGVVPFVGTPVLQGSATELIQQLQAQIQALQQAQGQAGGGQGGGQAQGNQGSGNQ